MNKKSIIFLIALLVIISLIVLILGGHSYNENSATITTYESSLTFKYNNDYSSAFYIDLTKGGSDSAYYDNKTLNGTITLDLSKVSWDENYVPVNESATSSVDYAKENFINDISTDLNTLKKEVNITYYDENKTPVEVVDYSVDQDAIHNNMTWESNKLKIDLFKDYQKDTVTEINDGSTIKGPLIAGTATKTNTVKSAKIEITLYNDDYCYHINVDVPNDKLKVEHF